MMVGPDREESITGSAVNGFAGYSIAIHGGPASAVLNAESMSAVMSAKERSTVRFMAIS